MNNDFKNIIFSLKNQVAEIRLNRPNVLNSFNYPMANEVIFALNHCKKEDNIRAIVLTAEGRAFCAGQDLEEATAEDATAEEAPAEEAPAEEAPAESETSNDEQSDESTSDDADSDDEKK